MSLAILSLPRPATSSPTALAPDLSTPHPTPDPNRSDLDVPPDAISGIDVSRDHRRITPHDLQASATGVGGTVTPRQSDSRPALLFAGQVRWSKSF
jgi:hypothetical protein